MVILLDGEGGLKARAEPWYHECMSKDDFEYTVVEVDEFEVMATTLLFAFVAPVFALLIEQVIHMPGSRASS